MNLADIEIVIANGLKPLASDLRLLALADFARHITHDEYAALAHLIDVASELYFKKGSIRFGQFVYMDLDWVTQPEIRIGLEFHDRRMRVYFDLLLYRDLAAIDLKYLSVSGSVAPGDNVASLESAMQDARL